MPSPPPAGRAVDREGLWRRRGRRRRQRRAREVGAGVVHHWGVVRAGAQHAHHGGGEAARADGIAWSGRCAAACFASFKNPTYAVVAFTATSSRAGSAFGEVLPLISARVLAPCTSQTMLCTFRHGPMHTQYPRLAALLRRLQRKRPPSLPRESSGARSVSLPLAPQHLRHTSSSTAPDATVATASGPGDARQQAPRGAGRVQGPESRRAARRWAHAPASGGGEAGARPVRGQGGARPGGLWCACDAPTHPPHRLRTKLSAQSCPHVCPQLGGRGRSSALRWTGTWRPRRFRSRPHRTG